VTFGLASHSVVVVVVVVVVPYKDSCVATGFAPQPTSQ
jgi:hypothetical protein